MPARPVLAALAAVALLLPVAAATAASASAPSGSDRLAAGSAYLAGYDQATTFTKASIKRFVVPDLACTAEAAGIEIGLGYEPVEGAREYIAGVVVECVDGLPSYRTDVLVNGVGAGSTEVAAGDVINAKLELVGETLTATLRNLTNPAGSVSVSAVVPRANGVTYGAFPVAGGGARLPVPDFDKVKIKNATVATGAKRLHRLGDPGIRTSKLKPGVTSMPPDNETFTLRHVVHCCL